MASINDSTFAGETIRKDGGGVALGNTAPDVLIANGTVFNAYTREFIPGQSVWVKDGFMAYVGSDRDPCRDSHTRVIDVDGRVLLPGLIDGHTHFAACRSGMEEFVRYIIPTGTTTVATETTELAVVGKEGIESLVKGLEDQPIRLSYTTPPLCGLTQAEETHAPSNQELLPFLKDPKCLGAGEIYWSNLFLEGKQAERMEELTSAGLAAAQTCPG